ncbi:MotA/TolQ/ExbB proton channel family protein [Prosthecobacter vanneervenii]|uniref:Biopolymer transport protein ExbB n=1 Tax=Prosthecobacter vanneervenii TaxID=48466 RepID=A0A7W7YG14_9BACT|nr:MotA/TolQ/ExbB proton channel family protein [Prosthecobacter vanneervenii]MBB5035439.1 biopolymer transport protein ExbB [Prosthecobacter vanneervenii]
MCSFTDLIVQSAVSPMLAAAATAAAEKTATAAAQPSGLQLLYEFLATGGFVMALIVLCSMAAIGASILSWLQMRPQIVMPNSVVSQLRAIPNYALKGDIRPLQEFLSNDASMLARLGSMAISGAFTSKQECHDACAIKAREEIHRLESGIPLLEVLITVAPLLGLLGTTAGLVGMFSAFGTGEGPDTTVIAHEIGVALRCTIAGLFVAVPSVLAHTYFTRRLDALAVRVESVMQEVIQHFYQHFEVQRPAA